jgi:DNA polymerase II small subunit/DNA polymerase delta subunit B
MNARVLENLEPVKEGFEAFEKRLVLAETKLNNLSSDQLVTYLKETKENSEQQKEAEEWKTDITTKLDNLEETVRKFSQFKGHVQAKTKDSGFKSDPMKTSSSIKNK